MLEVTRAKATLTVPYTPQEVCARLAVEKEFFDRHRLICTVTEQKIQLEPGRNYTGYTDSYTPSGDGTLTAVEGGTQIDMDFEPGVSGVMLLTFVLLFSIGSLVALLVQINRGAVLPWWRYAMPPGVLLIGILSLMESLHGHKNDMMFLLAQALGVET